MTMHKNNAPDGGGGVEGIPTGAAHALSDNANDTESVVVPASSNETAAFLNRFSTEKLHFRTFTDKKGARPSTDPLAHTFCGTLAELEPKLRSLNEQGAGVYFVVNEGGQKAAEITRVRALFVDLDGAPLDAVQNAAVKPHVVVESSPGRYHAYWLTSDFPKEDFTVAQRQIAEQFGGDRNVCDLPRVLRVPGFKHRSGHVVRVHTSNDDAPYPAGVLMPNREAARALAERHSVAQSPGTYAHVAPEQVVELQSALAHLDADNRDVWVANAHRLKELGPVGFQLWDDWSRRSDKYDHEDALRVWESAKTSDTGYQAVFSDAQRNGWSNPKAGKRRATVIRHSSGFHFERVDRIESKPIDWLIDGWLPTPGIAAIIGASGVGKSFLALDWALSVATGEDWCGHATKQGAVFYLAGEGGHGLRTRAQAWAEAHGTSLDDVPLYLAPSIPPLVDETGVESVLNAVRSTVQNEQVTPVLIVVDTLARALHDESDNDAKAMNAFVAAMDGLRVKFNATVVAVHHTGHENTGRGRGHSSFQAALDMWCLMRQAGPGLPIQLESQKEKDWPKPPLHAFNLAPVAVGNDQSCVLRDAGAGLTLPKDNTQEKRRRAHELRAQGMTQRDIAEKLGEPKTNVGRWLKQPLWAGPAGDDDDAS